MSQHVTKYKTQDGKTRRAGNSSSQKGIDKNGAPGNPGEETKKDAGAHPGAQSK